VISILWVRRVRPIYRSAHQERTDVDSAVSETFGGIRIVRTFQREHREERHHAVGRHSILRRWLYATRLELALQVVWGLLIPATSLLIVCGMAAHFICAARRRSATFSCSRFTRCCCFSRVADHFVDQLDAEIAGGAGAGFRCAGDAD